MHAESPPEVWTSNTQTVLEGSPSVNKVRGNYI
jgi:hypothetical protein